MCKCWLANDLGRPGTTYSLSALAVERDALRCRSTRTQNHERERTRTRTPIHKTCTRPVAPYAHKAHALEYMHTIKPLIEIRSSSCLSSVWLNTHSRTARWSTSTSFSHSEFQFMMSNSHVLVARFPSCGGAQDPLEPGERPEHPPEPSQNRKVCHPDTVSLLSFSFP